MDLNMAITGRRAVREYTHLVDPGLSYLLSRACVDSDLGQRAGSLDRRG
jgi:hypothetical protein